MKAVVCRAYGPPESLVIEDIPSPVAGPGEVVIAMRAAGVNFPDTLIIENKYQTKPPLPFSPGSEVAGIVSGVGPGVTRVRLGDPVMAVTTFGSFAEEVRTAEARVLPLAPSLGFTEAGGFLLAYGTSDHALGDRAALRAGETLLVLGASGGVGLAAVEIGKVLGARVIACASTAEKLATCVEHGADAVINYATEDLRQRIADLTDGRGIDVVYDPVGGAYTEPALRSLAWRGRLLVVGFASGVIPKLPLNLPLLKGSAIVGVFWGDFIRREPEKYRAQFERLGAWHAEGKLRPHVSLTLPLDRAVDALKTMAARKATGKIVLQHRSNSAAAPWPPPTHIVTTP